MKRCVFCGTENEDSATECVKCHNQLPDRPDGVEERVTGFTIDDNVGADEEQPAGLNLGASVAAGGPESEAAEPAAPKQDFTEPEMTDAAGTSAAEISAAGPAEEEPGQSETAGTVETAAEGPAAEEPRQSEAAETGAESAEATEPEEVPASEKPEEGEPLEDADRKAAGEAPGTPQGTGYNGAGYREAAAESFDRQPEGTTSGRIPARRAQAAADTSVGRGQTYAASQQYEARGGRYDASQKEQYGSAGYGYRQPAEGAQGRTDYTRMNTAVGSKTILFRSRKMVKGFFFFLMALSFTAMLAMNFWNCALPGTMDPSISNAQYNLNNASTYLASILGGANGFGVQLLSELTMHGVQMVTNVTGIIQQLGTSVQLAILLIIAVPNVLFALGLWLMFFQTKRKRAKFGMGGYTLARVMMILKFIVACLVLAIGLIISVYFVVVGASSAKFTSSFIQGLIMLIVMIVVAIFTIMYYVQWIFTFKCTKVNVRSGSDIGRVPVYIGIISILVALISAAGILPLAANDYVGIGAGAASALYFLVSGIWALIYHGYVKRPR